MKKALVILALLAVISTSASAFDFGDIQSWVGSGSNQAALVIDWNDGMNPVSLAWGFRWDAAATGRTMLDAVKAADSRLFETLGDYGSSAVYGLGYDLDGDGFTYVPGDDDTGHAADLDDHYREGWMYAGYWSYWGKSSSSASWVYPGSGLAIRTLTDGCWDGWSFAPAPTWDSGAPDNPTPVPEPGSLLALMSGLAGLGGLALRGRKS